MAAAMFFNGFGGGLVVPLQTRLMEVAGNAQTMAAASIQAAFNLANAIGPWLAGLALAAGMGWRSAGWVGAALSAGGLLIWFGMLLSDRKRQTRTRPARAAPSPCPARPCPHPPAAGRSARGRGRGSCRARRFRPGQQGRVDQPPVDRDERQRLEGQQFFSPPGTPRPAPSPATRFSMRMPYAPALVVAGLVGNDHAGLERRRCRSWRCAAGLRGPTGSCRRRGRCRGRSRARPATAHSAPACRAAQPLVPSGKRAVAMAIWPFSTSVKCRRMSSLGVADGDRAGDVGGAVDILRAGIDQIELARLELPVGRPW